MQGYSEDIAGEGRAAYLDAQNARLVEMAQANLLEGELAEMLKAESDVQLGHYRRAVEEALADEDGIEAFGLADLLLYQREIAYQEATRRAVPLRQAEVGDRVMYGGREHEVLTRRTEPGPAGNTYLQLGPVAADGTVDRNLDGALADLRTIAFYD